MYIELSWAGWLVSVFFICYVSNFFYAKKRCRKRRRKTKALKKLELNCLVKKKKNFFQRFCHEIMPQLPVEVETICQVFSCHFPQGNSTQVMTNERHSISPGGQVWGGGGITIRILVGIAFVGLTKTPVIFKLFIKLNLVWYLSKSKSNFVIPGIFCVFSLSLSPLTCS